MSSDYKAWQLPDMAGGSHERNDGLVTADQIEVLQKQAYEEGFAKGEQDGLRSGQQQLTSQINNFTRMINQLSTPVKQIDEEVSDQLVKLAITIAQQLIRREIKSDPGQIIGVVRDAVNELPVTARKVSVYLHPDDASLVRESLKVNDSDIAWKLIEDPAMSRGGCKVMTENSQINATVEKQLAEIVTRLLGGQRETDANGS